MAIVVGLGALIFGLAFILFVPREPDLPNVPQGAANPSIREEPSGPAPSNAPGTYTVRPGDTLFGIAGRLGVSEEQLRWWNLERYPSLRTNPQDIGVGWVLITAGEPMPTPTPRPTPIPQPPDSPVGPGGGGGGGGSAPNPQLPAITEVSSTSQAGYGIGSAAPITRITGSISDPSVNPHFYPRQAVFLVGLNLSSGTQISAANVVFVQPDGMATGYTSYRIGNADYVNVPIGAVNGQRLHIAIETDGTTVTITFRVPATGAIHSVSVQVGGMGTGAFWGFGHAGPYSVPNFGVVTYADVSVTAGGVTSGVRSTQFSTQRSQYNDGLIRVTTGGLGPGDSTFTLTPSQN